MFKGGCIHPALSADAAYNICHAISQVMHHVAYCACEGFAKLAPATSQTSKLSAVVSAIAAFVMMILVCQGHFGYSCCGALCCCAVEESLFCAAVVVTGLLYPCS